MSDIVPVQINIDKTLMRQADTLFADLGLDMQTAINVFLKQAVEYEGLPFPVAKPKPNAETLVALLEGMELQSKLYNNFQELIDEIEAEIALEDGYVPD